MRDLRALVVVAAGLTGLGLAPAAQAAVDARLQGPFQLRGRVTVAQHIPGERRGQVVNRIWQFTPGCAAGTCPTVTLVRARAQGTDTVTLRRRGTGHYTGQGQFYAPVRCGRRLYRRGFRVPFTISVIITAAAPSGGQLVATALSATYVNAARFNLTPCVAFPGHDSARYTGTLSG